MVETKHIHFQALNESLQKVAGMNFQISDAEHSHIFDGLSTKEKLTLLSKLKNLPEGYFEEIYRDKQERTYTKLQDLTFNPELKEILITLKKDFYLALNSNAIKNTVYQILDRLQIRNLFDLIYTNEDVKNAKPHPEMYWRTMIFFGINPRNTIIVEDSAIGREGAYNSGAHLLTVTSSKELKYNQFVPRIKKIELNSNSRIPWINPNLNVLIPMAGHGKRFEQAGYRMPKPLIDIDGKPMIYKIVKNLNIEARFIFLIRKDHEEQYHISSYLKTVVDNSHFIFVDKVTEGAACTSLLATYLIDNDNPLLIANSDQLIEWDSNRTMYEFESRDIDGAILIFKDTNPKWSFVKQNESGLVTEVAEKNPISDSATVGIYYWRRGSEYVHYAKRMIEKNVRTNGEFYICPVYNEALLDERKIITKLVDKMWGLGTPEDLDEYLNKR